MPSKAPAAHQAAQDLSAELAAGIRQQRLSLGISMVVAAHAAGMSRLTWHRIEKAEPSVTMGAYLGALDVIGLDITLQPRRAGGDRRLVKKSLHAPVLKPTPSGVTKSHEAFKVPLAIPIRSYPQLHQIAWHIHDDFELTQEEARNLYQRNSRYLDMDQMPAHEAELFNALQLADPLENTQA